MIQILTCSFFYGPRYFHKLPSTAIADIAIKYVFSMEIVIALRVASKQICINAHITWGHAILNL